MHLFYVLIPSIFFIQTSADYALLRARNENGTANYKEFCVTYNPQFSKVPEEIDDDDDYSPIDDLRSSYLCEITLAPNVNVTISGGSLPLVKRGNCSFFDKGIIAQRYGAMGVLIASNQLLMPDAENSSQYDELNISLALILNEDAAELENLGKQLEGVLYAPDMTSGFDSNMVLMWLLAMFTVTVGSYWSALQGFQIIKRKLRKSERVQNEDGTETEKEKDEVEITPLMIIIFVIVIISMIILLYFFYDYLVIFIIVIFVIASTLGLFTCFQPLVKKLPFFGFRLGQRRCDGRLVLLGLAAAALTVCWALYRHQDFAWILQDLMGVAFCIHLLQTLRLSSFKICSLLLGSLLVYDIFFVFITPYFTKDGQSVMVQVATGGAGGGAGSGGTKEEMPIVLKIPHFTPSPYAVCDDVHYSILGYGDILIPSLLVSYSCKFDFFVKSPMTYFISTCIGYGVGLVLCFVALLWMETGQPALLYLVPCTILTALGVALARKELKLFWTGNLLARTPKEGNTADRDGGDHVSDGSYNSNDDDAALDEDQQPLMKETDLYKNK